MKKRKIKRKAVFFAILILVLIAGGLYVGYKKILDKDETKTTVKVVDELKEYGYTLDENETAYYKKVFESLKKELNKSKVDDKEYASLISQLFLSDYFTLNNKTSKNDVGGIQFVYSSYQETFTKLSTEEVYKYIESNIYKNRKQELPVVKKVTIDEVTNEEIKYLNAIDENAIIVNATIEYEKDMGYQTEARLVFIHTEKKLELVKMS